MRMMSTEKAAAGGKAFGLYPIRRTNVPRHVRFDQKALRDVLGLGSSDHIKQKAKERRKRKRGDGTQETQADDDLNLPRFARFRVERANRWWQIPPRTVSLLW